MNRLLRVTEYPHRLKLSGRKLDTMDECEIDIIYVTYDTKKLIFSNLVDLIFVNYLHTFLIKKLFAYIIYDISPSLSLSLSLSQTHNHCM